MPLQMLWPKRRVAVQNHHTSRGENHLQHLHFCGSTLSSITHLLTNLNLTEKSNSTTTQAKFFQGNVAVMFTQSSWCH